jgi:hypothetical protein
MPVIIIVKMPPIKNHKNNIVRTTVKQRIVVGMYHANMIIKYHWFEEIDFESVAIHSPPSECTSPDIRLVFLLPAPSLYSRLLRCNVWKMVARIRAKTWSIGSTGRFSPARHHGALPA